MLLPAVAADVAGPPLSSMPSSSPSASAAAAEARDWSDMAAVREDVLMAADPARLAMEGGERAAALEAAADATGAGAGGIDDEEE